MAVRRTAAGVMAVWIVNSALRRAGTKRENQVSVSSRGNVSETVFFFFDGFLSHIGFATIIHLTVQLSLSASAGFLCRYVKKR